MNRLFVSKSGLVKLAAVVAAGAFLVFAPVASATVVYQSVYADDPTMNFDGDILSITTTFDTVSNPYGTDDQTLIDLNLSPSPTTESNQYDQYAQLRGSFPGIPTPLSNHEISSSDPFNGSPGTPALLFEFDDILGDGEAETGNFYPAPPGDDLQIGLALTLPDGLTHYAWIDYETVFVTTQGYNGKYYGLVTGFAYETQPNTPILSGQIPVPEPAAGGIAITAAAVAVFRQRATRQVK